MEKKISIIGLGKMGSAIAKNLAKHGYEVFGYDVAEVKFGKTIHVLESMGELLNKNLPLIVSVKPGHIQTVLEKIVDKRLVISVAAGISTKKLKSFRYTDGPTIRVMPNTPFLINEGISALFSCPDSSDEDKNFALEIFQSGGQAFYISNEDMMHAITGLSGSGPAFVELFIQAMEDAGVLMGLPREMSRLLATQTTIGGGKLVQKSGRSPQDLIHDVTSPGGTTISGIHALKDFSFERAIIRAVKKAAEKSRQLSGDA
ncbi:MAG: pyrroline-5-carboxylate reductase [Spirochaetia bacterium]|nr:pyrroline-5-carboxylate reductase [Spirochaetia bacterium]